jgi:hypothetical protein
MMPVERLTVEVERSPEIFPVVVELSEEVIPLIAFYASYEKFNSLIGGESG